MRVCKDSTDQTFLLDREDARVSFQVDPARIFYRLEEN